MDLIKNIDYFNDLLVHKHGASARIVKEDYVIYQFVGSDGITEVIVPLDSINYAINTAGIPKELYTHLE
jgi:hypothetical protein